MSDSDTVAEPVTKHKYLALSSYYANLFEDFWAGPSAVFQADKDYIYVNSTLAPLCKPQTTPVLAFGAFAEPWELREDLATSLWGQWQMTAGKGLKKQFLAASWLLASQLRLEPICASVLLRVCPGSRQRSLLRSSATSRAFQEQRRMDAMCPCGCASHPSGPGHRDKISTKRKVQKWSIHVECLV